MTGRSDFTIKFWGVRGSLAVPGPDTIRFGGNTPCVEVRCGHHLMIFDAGTGIRELGLKLKQFGPVNADLFLSHTHLDHIIGLPFFKPAYDGANFLRLWAGHLPTDTSIESVISAMMTAPLLPVPVRMLKGLKEFVDFSSGETLVPRPGIRVQTVALNHPNNACGYRVEFEGRSMCYMTDLEHYTDHLDQTIVEFVRGADVMIYDSMYTDTEYTDKVGWGHSTWQEACRVAAAADVGRTVLFHHEPEHTDRVLDRIAAAADEMRPGTLVAHEGLELRI